MVFTDVGIVAEEEAERGLGVCWKKVEAAVGGSDVVGLLDDELTVIVIALDRPEKVKASRRPKRANTAPSMAPLTEAVGWRRRRLRPSFSRRMIAGKRASAVMGWILVTWKKDSVRRISIPVTTL